MDRSKESQKMEVLIREYLKYNNITHIDFIGYLLSTCMSCISFISDEKLQGKFCETLPRDCEVPFVFFKGLVTHVMEGLEKKENG